MSCVFAAAIWKSIVWWSTESVGRRGELDGRAEQWIGRLCIKIGRNALRDVDGGVWGILRRLRLVPSMVRPRRLNTATTEMLRG